jgi:hypothetical protein
MATGARAEREGGQLAKKSLRGGMRRCRRQSARRDPRPPLAPVLQSEIPFHLTCVVLPYGQRVQPQPLARVSQTSAVGVVCLMAGERRLTVHKRREAGLPARAAGLPLARAVIVYNLRDVTHLIPYYGTRVFPPTPHALRSTYHDRVACALTEPHSLARTRTNLCPSSLFYCHRITQRYFYPR